MILKIEKNPDEAVRKSVMNNIRKNGGYCPCKVGRIEANKCMCQEFKNQNKPGYCKCRLYKKVALESQEPEYNLDR